MSAKGGRKSISLMKTVSLVTGCLTLLTAAAFLLPPSCRADTEAAIGHLMAFIENSGCTFIRNDQAYDAAEARQHIQNKYDYARRWINTAEDVIQYTATRSKTLGCSRTKYNINNSISGHLRYHVIEKIQHTISKITEIIYGAIENILKGIG